MTSPLTVVTGGGGYIGRHLVHRLVARGERVRILEKPGTEVLHPARVEVVFADCLDRILGTDADVVDEDVDLAEVSDRFFGRA